VITGVQAILKASKILDSGFRRNDGKKTDPDFFTVSGERGATQRREFRKINARKGGKEEWLIRKSIIRPCPRGRWMR
jgi:hypothetical protein